VFVDRFFEVFFAESGTLRLVYALFAYRSSEYPICLPKCEKMRENGTSEAWRALQAIATPRLYGIGRRSSVLLFGSRRIGVVVGVVEGLLARRVRAMILLPYTLLNKLIARNTASRASVGGFSVMASST